LSLWAEVQELSKVFLVLRLFVSQRSIKIRLKGYFQVFSGTISLARLGTIGVLNLKGRVKSGYTG
jgi:hypothetical protein